MKKHLLSHYLILAGGLALGFFSYFAFTGRVQMRIYTSMFLSIFYLLWGVWHHAVEKNLHLKVVLEYLVVAILASSVLISLAVRA